jgi:hypothetical protein
MFAIGLQTQEAPPTIAEYIFGSLFGLFFLVMAVWAILALFSDRQRSRLHWGRGQSRRPISKLGLLMALPLLLYIPARYVVYLIAAAAGHEKTWPLPLWWFFPFAALFVLGGLIDKLRS